MKRVSLMLTLAMLGLLAAAPTVQAGSTTSFTGVWTATDSVDGSDMRLIVGPGPRPQILFIDEHATGGVCAGRATDHFTGLVRGFVDGDFLTGTFIVIKCGNATVITRNPLDPFSVEWELQNGGTELQDSFGDTWTRA